MKKLFLISVAAVCAAMICSCSSSNKAELSLDYYLTFAIDGEEDVVCADTCAAEAAAEEVYADSICAVDEVEYTADGEACCGANVKVFVDEDGNEVEVVECVDTVVAPEPGYDYTTPAFNPMAGLRAKVEEANENYKSLSVKADEINEILEKYFSGFQGGEISAVINVYAVPVLTAKLPNAEKVLKATYCIYPGEAAAGEAVVAE